MAQRRPRAEPAYRAIAEQLRAEIESGRFGDGQQLPSESEVMARFRVSRETARRAYIELVAAGNAARRQGFGSFAVRRDQRLSSGSIGDLAAHTRSSSVEVTEALAVRRDPELAAALGASDDRVATFTFKWLKGGLPYCVARIGLPVTVGNRLLER